MYNKSFFSRFLAPDIWSLAFFFQSHADSQRYNKSFFSWIIFGSWYLVTCLFLSISCHLWNVQTAATTWDPMSSSMYNESFFSWIIFCSWYLVTFLFLSISCRLGPLKRRVSCWLMGPACHPLCTIKFFSWIFYPLIFGHLPFSFDPVPPLKLWTLLAHGSHMPASMNNNISFLGFFFTPDFWLFAFFFGSPTAFETMRTLLAHSSHMSASKNNKHFFSWIYSWPLINGYFAFFFDPQPP